jgi:hypothetical protein
MRAVRFLSFAFLLVVGLAGTAMAGGYFNTPGVYPDVKVGVVPALLPGGSLPGTGTLGPDIYIGTLTITGGAGGFTATYQGERFHGLPTDTDGAKLNASASFNGNWAGVLLGSLLVGSSVETNVIVGIDSPNLLSANVNGVGTVDGGNRRIIARFGPGPTLTQFKVLKAPGFLR